MPFRSLYNCTKCKHCFDETTEVCPAADYYPKCPKCEESKRVKFKGGSSVKKNGSSIYKKPKMEHRYRCKSCSVYFYKPSLIPLKRMPRCPECDISSAVVHSPKINNIISEKSKIQNKAIDQTAEIVMDDYKLGNLRSDIRVGETAAPKLAPHLQKQADSFFGGGKGRLSMRAPNGQTMQTPFSAAQLKSAALSGGLRDKKVDPVAALNANLKPRVNIVASD